MADKILTPPITSMTDAFSVKGYNVVITGGNRGGGKANTYGTPVITPTGTKRMGKLEIGDEICTPYEGIQKVSAIYEQGEQTLEAEPVQEEALD